MRDNKPQVADVINYERDIKGHRLIRLSAGVGAGKNYWTGRLAAQGFRVLVITSRAITAEAQAEKLGADLKINIKRLIDSNGEWGTACWDAQTKVVCTNAHIATFLRKHYKKDDPATHIWNKFDFIILDEAHSLSCDATFADSPFYVERFLKYAYRENPNCHIVLMSGTQEPIDWLFAGEHNRGLTHVIDCFKDCIHLEPQIVRFFPISDSINKLMYYWRKGKRVIYFANTIARIESLVKSLVYLGVPEYDIGISYSNDERDALFSDFLVKRTHEIKDSLTEKELLPQAVKIFITTTKNKEGISINDTDIFTMFAESHQRSELVQMAGRVRNGLRELCVIYDAPQHSTITDYFKETLDRNCLEDIRNTTAEMRRKGVSSEREAEQRQYIEETFPCVRYDILTEEYCYYSGRRHGAQQQRRDAAKLSECIMDVLENGKNPEASLLRAWFPYSTIRVYVDCPPIERAKNSLQELLEENDWLNKTIDREACEAIKNHIKKQVALYGEKDLNIKRDFSSFVPVMKKLGYSAKAVGRNGTGQYRITKGE